jgi:endonuclease I
MKKTIYLLLILCTPLIAQSPDYYNSIQQLTGENLEDALHDIIKEHNEFSYSSAKQILKDSDQDPNNNSNIMLVYKGISIPKSSFASNNESDYWNREHVWAKSHGNFSDYSDLGAYSDAHNLKPCDATVNSARGYKDFDNGGIAHDEATECNYTSSTWEPRDDSKGDVARIIFYMHCRYSGDTGEPNLNVVDFINTFPNAQMGRLSTLLEWNEQDPVDAFERRRNDVIYGWQNNRNPFIDYPDLANRIWGDEALNEIQFVNVGLGNAAPNEDNEQTINAEITTNISSSVSNATLVWGTSWYELNNEVSMSSLDDIWSATIPSQIAGADVKYKIVALAGTYENTFYGNYKVNLNPFAGTITSIQSIQGTTEDSPYQGQTVSTTGIVTASYGNDFYIQNGAGTRSGIYIYSASVFPVLGDSVIVTGEVTEYNNLTEFAFPDEVFILTSNNPIPEPISINTGDLANEDYEGVLVKVNNVTVTYATFNFDDYGAWRVNDGTGECIIHNTEEGYEYPAEVAEQIGAITGICNYNFGEWKIDLRIEDDVEAGADTNGPIITSVEAINESTIIVLFSEEVTVISSEDLSNYSISNEAMITNAARHPFQPNKVTLTVENMFTGDNILTISNVEDVLGNPLTESNFSFTWLSLLDENKALFNIYPNPNSGSFNIIGLEKNEMVTILNSLGQTVHTYKVEKEGLQINLNLVKGIYLIKTEHKQRYFIVNQ